MAFKQRFFKLFYNSTGQYSKRRRSTKRFMNLGYAGDPVDGLKPQDETDESHMALYRATLFGLELKNKAVLEVGCGRGGGCYYMAEYLGAHKVVGIDLSEENIHICRELIRLENVDFQVGNAEDFNLQDAPFDVVVNLESSHCYASRSAFFTQVHAALKTGGEFAYADLYERSKVSEVEDLLAKSGFEIIHQKDLTSGVVESIDKHSGERFPFTTKYPFLVPRFIKNMNVSKGSDVYNRLRARTAVYKAYLLKKR